MTLEYGSQPMQHEFTKENRKINSIFAITVNTLNLLFTIKNIFPPFETCTAYQAVFVTNYSNKNNQYKKS